MFCHNCIQEICAKLHTRHEEYVICGEWIDVQRTVPVCPHCKIELFSPYYESVGIEKATALYRKKYNLLSPGEIFDFRQELNLSQQDLARLLGCTAEKIFHYETEGIISREHNEELQRYMKRYNRFYEPA